MKAPLTQRFTLPLICAASLSLYSLTVNAVEYQVTFTGTWNANDVVGQLPISAHFTQLVGATHTEGATFWSTGSMASIGVENVAELGNTSNLRTELIAQQQAGTSGPYIQIGSLSNFPRSSTSQIEVSDDKSFVTLISMIAPSPDWFIGVSNLSLIESGTWIPSLTVNLLPYDAGTESGDGFSLSNPASNPQEPITRLSGTPFNGRPSIGTVEFRLIQQPVVVPPPTSNTEGTPIPAVVSLLLDQ